MNACFMGKGILAHDGLVALYRDAGDVGYQPARGTEAFRVDGSPEVEEIAAGPHRHDDFLQRAVAGAFAEAVDGALNLPGSFGQGCEAVRHGEPEIIVTVDAEDYFVDAGDGLLQVPENRGILIGNRIPHGIGDVHGGGAGFDGAFDHFGEEIKLGARGILRRELDVVAIFLGPRNALDGPANNFFLGHAQLELAMNRAGGQEDVNARLVRRPHRFPGPVDVLVIATRKPADHRTVNLLRN